MAAKNTRSKLQWHPSLKKVFKGCAQWWESWMVRRNELERSRDNLRSGLSNTTGYLRVHPSTLMLIAQTYSIDACIRSGSSELEGIAQPLRWGVQFRSLDFRSLAGRSLPVIDANPVLPFKAGNQAVGPTMLSDWEVGRVCAEQLIAVAHKDQDLNVPEIRKDGWGRGTSDAFLIYLLSQAYEISTHYEPVNRLAEPYQQLLDAWRTKDETRFQSAMTAAAEFHIKCSYYGGAGKKDFEFETAFDLVYPGELLAVQALRRRDGLPEFKTGHVLVDTPWSIIRDLPPVDRHPLAVETEQRLKHDFPGFR